MKTYFLPAPENDDIYYYKKSWLQLIRPLTLTGTISPVLVGTGLAMLQRPVQWDLFVALLLSALLIQSAANVLNDYYDFKYGQDKEKWVEKGEAGHHGPAHYTLPFLAGMMLAAAIGIGLWLAIHSSLWIILPGVLGIAAGYKYSAGKHSFSSIGLGETIAALFLGPVVTLLAYFVQTNTINVSVVSVSLVFAMLIASMILTNNIRDLKKDMGYRKTLAYKLGKKHAKMLLLFLLILPYAALVTLVISHILPLSALLALLAVPAALRLLWSFRKTGTREDEIGGMKWAARHHWAFGMLLALGIWLL
jgi:1,4-dihydroxy-2-naphthoate octaprenyltransferase